MAVVMSAAAHLNVTSTPSQSASLLWFTIATLAPAREAFASSV